MAAEEKWYFTKEQLANAPSRKTGYDADKELSCRQQAANFIQDMGQRLQVSQLCINTAIVYMHRFYVFHSFKHFHRHSMAAAALFLAAKVEEQPRKLEHVIKVTQICLHRGQAVPPLDVKSDQYLEQAQDLVFNENVLLQTLGFDVAIDHPHTHVVRCCHLVRASKDLAQTSYFMASNSLHLTTMCLQYKPTVVACFCIHLACKWSNWEIPQSNEGKYWFYYVDRTVTQDLLEQLTAEFLVIFDKCPSRLKRNIMTANQNPSNVPATYQLDKMPPRDNMHEGVSFQTPPQPNKPSSSQASQPSAPGQRPDSREYQEKRERERQMASQGASSSQHREGHHRGQHPAHPHPSSGAALLKPHAGAPPHASKPPHPPQQLHRPAPPHHSHHGRPEQQRARPEHHNRIETLRPDQVRSEHLQRLDHPVRPEHPQRAAHPSRIDHPQRPDQINRTDHQIRPDHLGRSEHPNRPDHLLRPDHQIREHQGRPDHQMRPEQAVRTEHNRSELPGRSDQPVVQDRSESSDRHIHPDMRHGGVTAARDQLRREAALLREASRRDNIISMPSSLINHSPAQRTLGGDCVGSSSSTVTPSSQDWAGFGAVPAGAPTSVHIPKHPGHSESSLRQFGSQDMKPKSNSSSIDAFSRHRSSMPGADRRQISSNSTAGSVPSAITASNVTSSNSGGSVKDVLSSKQPIVPYNSQAPPPPSSSRHRRPHDNLLNLPPVPREDSSNASVSLDRKMMQDISERRQLESFFGKTEAIERLNEKHQTKHSILPHKEVKKELEVAPVSSQHSAMTLNIKREKSPGRQVTMAPPVRIKAEPPSPPTSTQHNNYKSVPSQFSSGKPIKAEAGMEPSCETRNGTAAPPPLITPKVERMECDFKGDTAALNRALPVVKGSIFSPEKTATPRGRESPPTQRSSKSSCPPSPGIAFGSPPVTPGKPQGTSNRNRSTSSCSDPEPVIELTKIDREPGFENVVRDGRIDMKSSVAGLQQESCAQIPMIKGLDARHQVPNVKLESRPQVPPKFVNVSHPKSPTLTSGMTSPVMSQGRSSQSISEDHQMSKCKVPVSLDIRPGSSVRSSDSRPPTLTSIGGDLGAVAFPSSDMKETTLSLVPDESTSDHHHKSKKKKEKKEKHKHKDKDKEKRREEKKHKSKHKERDKEREKVECMPSDLSQGSNQALPAIKLTIAKVNITPPPAPQPVAATPASGGSLKLKINLAQISSATSASSTTTPKDSRKRDRDRSSPALESSTPKIPKLSTVMDVPKRGGGSSSSGSSKSGYSRQNGLESRSGGRHGQQSHHYSGSKMGSGGSSTKPSEMPKGGSSHSSTS